MRNVGRRVLIILTPPAIVVGILPACVALALLLYVRTLVMIALSLGEQIPRRWSPLGPHWRLDRRAV
jgi:hypothetical protein